MSAAESIALLFSRAARRKYVLAVCGTLLMALMDVVGVAAVVPLMQVLTGAPRDEGVLGWVSGVLGDPSDEVLAIALAALTFGAFLMKGVISLFFRWWLLGFVAGEEAATSTRLLHYYLDAPYGLHLKRNSSELLRTMNDAVKTVYSQVAVSVMNIISDGITIVAVAVALVVLVPVPALLLVGYFAIAAGVMYGVVRPLAHRIGQRMVESWVQIYQHAMHSLGGVKEIKVRHVSSYFLTAYGTGRREFAEAQRAASFIAELPKYVLEVLFILGIGGLTALIFFFTPSGEAIGILAVIATAGFRLLPSAVRLMGSLNMVRVGRPSLDLVLEDLRAAEVLENANGARAQVTPADHALDSDGNISIEQVSFVHEGREQPAIDNISFVIPRGTSTAFVGGSGAGKTTLVDLLLGLYTPTSGHIRAGGVDIHDVLPDWQKRVGLVAQEVYLLDDTLRANIAFGIEDSAIDDDLLAEAIADAQLGELVASLPDGLDTVVGERGARLSGGQRQRIGIARALYSRPELLILDEATSALDNQTERRIADTISDLQGKMTIVIVAHRLSTVRHCDQIVFLRDGAVDAAGDFDGLRDSSPEFAQLVALGELT